MFPPSREDKFTVPCILPQPREGSYGQAGIGAVKYILAKCRPSVGGEPWLVWRGNDLEARSFFVF